MTPPATQGTARQDRAAILKLLEDIARAHYEKSASGIAAPYAPHAVIYDLEPPLAHDGIDPKRKEAWLGTWEGPVTIATQGIAVKVAGDVAFAHGYVRLAGRKKGAAHDVDFWMRQTVCLERRDGNWRIVHEHTSVPFYMDESLRPAFDLKP